ncbi:MAG: prolipoprotein diacylglyceryl transferase family protein [Acidimicrobiales bacterium]
MNAGKRTDALRISRTAGIRSGETSSGLRVERFDWETLAETGAQALGLTYWFDPQAANVSGPATIRFSGRRADRNGKPGPRDRFSVEESLDVPPGAGPLSVTTRIRDINPGTWETTAVLVGAQAPRARPPRPKVAPASASGTTAYAPIIQVRAPGARFGAWPALVGIGAVVGLVVQGLLARHLHLSVARVEVVSLVAAAIGLLAAKAYYAIGHYAKGERSMRELLSGACIQGFVLGAGAALAAGTQIAGLPLGTILDLSAPGLLFGMTIGRYGCFFGGCCVGRPTASRWGLWSSDRRLWVRRVPVQLFESTAALAIGIAALAVAWNGPVGHAELFAGAMAAYTLARQLLFPLRAVSRHTSHGWRLTIVASVAALLADIVVALIVG